MPGEFDDQLKWLAHIELRVELANQQGGENASFTLSALNLEKSDCNCLLKHCIFISHPTYKIT